MAESNLFWPITWEAALIQGWELTLRSSTIVASRPVSPFVLKSNCGATAPITVVDLSNAGVDHCADIPPGYSPVDHDQEEHLNVGFNANLPWQTFASTNVYYGSDSQTEIRTRDIPELPARAHHV